MSAECVDWAEASSVIVDTMESGVCASGGMNAQSSVRRVGAATATGNGEARYPVQGAAGVLEPVPRVLLKHDRSVSPTRSRGRRNASMLDKRREAWCGACVH